MVLSTYIFIYIYVLIIELYNFNLIIKKLKQEKQV